MTFVKRVLAIIVVLVSVAGLLLALAGGVGIWTVKQSVTETVTGILDRIGEGIDVARENLQQVKVSLARAQERLSEARAENRRIAQEPENGPNLRRMMARSVTQFVAPELGDANAKMYDIAKASVVVNSILEDVGNFPLLDVAGFNVEEISSLNEQLAAVGPTAFELSRLLNDPNASTADAEAQVSRIEQTVTALKGWVVKYEQMLADVQDRKVDLTNRTLPWITPGAILISLACFWIAVSQVGMLFHAQRWWRH